MTGAGASGYVDAETFARRMECLILVVGAMFVVLGTYAFSFGDTADSRLATVLSLTQDGTFYLDRPLDQPPNYFERRTIDKVVVNGHILSSKPPLLPLLMTGEYVVMHALLGWELLDEADRPDIIRWMSMTLIGGSYFLALLFFMKTLRLFEVAPLTRVVLLLSLAFGTQLWGYGTNINNHVPAAGMLVVALYFGLGLGSGRLPLRPWRFMVFGLCEGLAVTFDMPAAVFAGAVGLFVLVRQPRATILWTAPFAAIPVLAHAGVMMVATGSFLPVQVHGDPYLSEASYWRNPRGIDALNEPRGVYLFHMTFGRCGLFSLYPILFAGVAAAVRALVYRDMPRRGYLIAGLCAFLALTAYYALTTNNYGGEAYGFRWYIVAMPVLLLMAAPLLGTLHKPWQWFFVCLLVGVSFYSGWECAKAPWGANHQWTCRFLGPSYGRWE